MWSRIGKFLGRAEPALSESTERWVLSQAEFVATLVRQQLKANGLSPMEAWRRNRAPFLGYICGMTEHLCAKQKIKKSVPGVALLALVAIVEDGLTPDEIMTACVSLQQIQDIGYVAAHEIGWHDLGVLSPNAMPTGLSKLLV